MGNWLSSSRHRLLTREGRVTAWSRSYDHFCPALLRRVGMTAAATSPLRSPPPGRQIRECATTQPLSCDHFRHPLLRCCMEPESFSPLRRPLRGWLRPSLPLSFRVTTSPRNDQSPPQRHLRAWRFADIPTPLPVQNIEGVAAVLIALSISSASLALDSCAIASALAPQRLSITSATVIALVLATPPPQSPGSALASQRFAVNRPWGSA
jgi:hypothetical protein